MKKSIAAAGNASRLEICRPPILDATLVLQGSPRKRSYNSMASLPSFPGSDGEIHSFSARSSEKSGSLSAALPTSPYGVIPSLQHTPNQEFDPKQSPRSFGHLGDDLYPIFNVDSGLGGLLYMLDTTEEIGPDLAEISRHYKVQFTMVHIGAANWAPFGNKSFEQIQSHTLSLLEETSRRHSRITTIACNTASTTMDEAAIRWTKEFINNVSVIPIITPTAKILYEEARFVPNTRGGLEKHIGVLATQATTRSQQYHLELATQHALSFGENAITIIVCPSEHRPLATDSDLVWINVYKGSTPIPAGSREEDKIMRGIHRYYYDPILFVYPYAPLNWVSIMEGKLAADLKSEVTMDMIKYIHQIGLNKSKVSIIGTCCTHYPGVIPIIHEIFDTAKFRGIKILSQGARIGRDVILKIIEWQVSEGRFKARHGDEEAAPVSLTSYTTIDDDMTATIATVENHPSLIPAKIIADNIYPELAQLTEFFAIRPLVAPSQTIEAPPYFV
jgi:glutamate racemase